MILSEKQGVLFDNEKYYGTTELFFQKRKLYTFKINLL